MKAFLMHPDRDFDTEAALPDNDSELVADLELETLIAAMADGDPLLAQTAGRALLRGLVDPATITYRQRALADCLDNPAITRELYELAGEALTAERRVFRSLSRDSPRSIVSRSVEVLTLMSDFLKRLRTFAHEHASSFSSEAFTGLFATLTEELGDGYLAVMDERLAELRFPDGQLISAQLGAGNHGIGYTLRQAPPRSWLARLNFLDRSGYTFTIPERDQAGFVALGELEDRGLNLAADALHLATEHVMGFFSMLRIELAFYVGCLNLSDRLAGLEAPVCFPEPAPADPERLSATGLYDVCLALTVNRAVVGNDVDADGKSLVMITGANQGGKSTWLRAVGLAQLMTQAGMFAAAQALGVNVCTGVFTHFKREEDETMRSGKLDEELHRMSGIVDRIAAHGLLLCNESFASTNEREGSEIARQIVTAMLDCEVKVLFVTHQYSLADGFYEDRSPRALFLRAARERSGDRTYKITPGEPLPTSYGEDSYRKVFGEQLPDPSAPRPTPTAGRER